MMENGNLALPDEAAVEAGGWSGVDAENEDDYSFGGSVYGGRYAGELTFPRKGSHVELGRRGEDATCAFLERMGLEIIARNWKCIAGEADIIARDDSTLRFVEVKTRMGMGMGFPEEAVSREKRRRYESIAELFLRDYGDVGFLVSFDIVSINVLGADRAFMRYYKNAFCRDEA